MDLFQVLDLHISSSAFTTLIFMDSLLNDLNHLFKYISISNKPKIILYCFSYSKSFNDLTGM